MRSIVIFDLGGVLIDWDPRYLYRKLFQDEAEMERFLNTVCTPDWNEQQDAGRPIAEAVALLTAQHPRCADQIEAFYGRWTEMLGGPITATVAVLDDLRRGGVPLYALTNWSAETFPHVEGHYPFLDWFDGLLVSGREGMKKPDLRIYQRLLDRYRIDPQAAVFIDDNARNVAAARNLGLHSILFTTAEALREELHVLGLL